MFVGRKKELALLDEAYTSKKGELVVIYGRRRIGKSRLIQNFTQGKKKVFSFEALENETTQKQISHFAQQLQKQTNDPLLDSVDLKKWENIFYYFTERTLQFKKSAKGKTILFFDEFQWMAVGRSRLVSLLKFFWDNFWKEKNIMLILCGSIASFMVKKVLRSKALYGRTTLEILLKGLSPVDSLSLLRQKRSNEETMKYIMVFGGVPKYLEQINTNKSFNQNMNVLCFSSQGIMVHEVDRIFYNQFREARTYLRIVNLLEDSIHSMGEISKKLKIASGGGLKQYLDNLELAEIIRPYTPLDRLETSKFKKYTLCDEYLLFYFKYIKPNIKTINESTSKKKFETLTGEGFKSWLGFSFERFCLKYSGTLARIMNFEDEVLLASPFFGRNDRKFQIDLLYKRADKVITICEIKHHNKKIGTKIIPEMERKCSLFKAPRDYTVEKALISLYGPDESLKNTDYFHHIVTLDDIFENVSSTPD
ncbi:MAG: hypothetical protein DRH93_01665 [Deltaproteobacteria bacterium]|nr:MAG: hypothetical protein DRH93_01665 [Deltaproteobacteria bacterium]